MTSYSIESYVTVRSARSASFAPDGSRIAFLLDTTGTAQVWTLEGPGEWPEQRTFYDERITFVDWSPTRNELAFGMDEGGNERAQLYRLDLDDGTVTNWTQRPDAKHRWGGWSTDGDRFAFVSNRRNEGSFDAYVQTRDETGTEADLVFEGDRSYSVSCWGPDDRRLLLRENSASFDHRLHALDLETGTVDHLTPGDDEVRYRNATWVGDGVYVCTDELADTLQLVRIDVDTAERAVVVDGGDWNVSGAEAHAESGRIVYTRNVDGYTEVNVGTLADPSTVRSVSITDSPPGVAGGIDFAPSGDRFTLTVSPTTDATNVYVVDADTSAAERWTRAPTGGIPPERFREPELVRYETFDGREIPAFLTLPDDADAGETPVLVSIHGGPQSQRRPSFRSTRQYFANRGYAVFEPNVRGSTGYGSEYHHLDDVENRMDSVADIEAGVRWLTEHPAVDPDKIAVRGGSYGGFMVLAAMTEYPDLWAAGVDVVGIANWITFLENTGDWRRERREAEYGSLANDREFLESISPIHEIDRIDAPLLVLHGENDPRVPVSEARQVARKAEEQGVPVDTLLFEDEGHGFSKLDNRIEATTAIADFLDEHV